MITQYPTKNPNGQATMANSEPVVIASDQSAVPVTATLAAETTKVIGTVNQGTSPWVVSGAVSATGGLTDTELRATAVPVSLASVPSHNVTNAGTFAVQATLGTETTKVIGTVNIAAAQTLATVTTVGTVSAVTAITNALPAGTNAIGKLTANDGVDIGDVTINNASIAVTGTFWQATQPVSIAATVATTSAANSTGTQTNPALTAASATLLAANASRKAATIYNNSSSIVYVRLSGTAASATTFTVKLNPTDYYEVPGFYSGVITAILNTGSTSDVQVTEIT